MGEYAMCREVFELLRKEWLHVAAIMLAGLLTATAITYITANTPWGSPVITFLIWTIIIGTARTYGLIRFSGKTASLGRIAKRICVDAGFMAMLGLILLVIPLAEFFALYAGVSEVATAVGLLWYYFAILFLVLLVDLFYMGHLVAVEDKSIEDALVESARRFREDKVGTVKKVMMYWAPAVIYVAGNWATAGAKGPMADVLSWATVIVTVLLVIPMMEAVYVLGCGSSNLKNRSDQSSTRGA